MLSLSMGDGLHLAAEQEKVMSSAFSSPSLNGLGPSMLAGGFSGVSFVSHSHSVIRTSSHPLRTGRSSDSLNSGA